MKKNIIFSVTFLMLALLLSGCNGTNRETVGLIGGGVAGGLIGSAVTGRSTAGTIIGAVGGAAVGRSVARRTR